MTSTVSGRALGGRIVRAAVTTILSSPFVSGAAVCASAGEESAVQASAAATILRIILNSC
jgi:hypothetical protein